MKIMNLMEMNVLARQPVSPSVAIHQVPAQPERFTKRSDASGVTLLFVTLVVAAVLSIAIGIFNAVFSEFRLAGEISQSFAALYAADEGIERLLYCERTPGSGCDPCPGPGSCTYGPVTTSLTNGACYTVSLNRTGSQVTIVSTGEFRCGSPTLAVKRALRVTYTQVGP